MKPEEGTTKNGRRPGVGGGRFGRFAQLNSNRVFFGNSLNQISSSKNFLNQDTVNLSQQENTLAGADIAAVVTNYSQAELARQAAISAASQVWQQKTLLDYIV